MVSWLRSTGFGADNKRSAETHAEMTNVKTIWGHGAPPSLMGEPCTRIHSLLSPGGTIILPNCVYCLGATGCAW